MIAASCMSKQRIGLDGKLGDALADAKDIPRLSGYAMKAQGTPELAQFNHS